MTTQKTFTSMVIAGGAMKSMSAIGCAQYLEETNLLQFIRNFLGTSAGSVVSLFLVLGYSPNEMEQFLMTYLHRNDIATLDINEAFNLIDSLGLNKGKSIELFVSQMLLGKLGLEDATFLDLAKHTGRNLIVCVTNLTRNVTEFWSVDTMPNMSVIKAIRASCAIPFVFTPIFYNNCIFVDGGVLDNFPITYFANTTLGDVIGFNILSRVRKNENNTKASFVDYVSLVSSTIMNKLMAAHDVDDEKMLIVTVEVEEHMWVSLENMQIEFQHDILKEYIKEGYDKTKQALRLKH